MIESQQWAPEVTNEGVSEMGLDVWHRPRTWGDHGENSSFPSLLFCDLKLTLKSYIALLSSQQVSFPYKLACLDS